MAASESALAKAPGEDTKAFLDRMKSTVANLATSKNRSAAQLRLANQTADEMRIELMKAAKERKLNPLAIAGINQLCIALTAGTEEALLEGKPYIALPLAIAGSLASVGAYVLGFGKSGDAALSLGLAGLSVLNVRASSRAGARIREARLKAKNEAPAAAAAPKA